MVFFGGGGGGVRENVIGRLYIFAGRVTPGSTYSTLRTLNHQNINLVIELLLFHFYDTLRLFYS